MPSVCAFSGRRVVAGSCDGLNSHEIFERTYRQRDRYSDLGMYSLSADSFHGQKDRGGGGHACEPCIRDCEGVERTAGKRRVIE